MAFQARLIGSLEKVFGDVPGFVAPVFSSVSALRGEVVSFQTAVSSDCGEWMMVSVSSDIPGTGVREVGQVQGSLAGIEGDSNYLRTAPGLFPDPLLPFDGNFKAPKNRWVSLWITVPVSEKCRAGKHKIEISLKSSPINQWMPEPRQEEKLIFTVDVKKASLPEQKLIHTEWFHSDCIYKYYDVPCWSEEHWALLEKYFRNAVSLGINMLLTPLWTPPLDTARGGERPTVQLAGIRKKGKKYTFDLARLRRWFELGIKCGFRYFDFAHPFTQWGAEFTPKIVADVNGKEEKIFGWHVSSSSAEYASFLKQLIPQVLDIVREFGLEKNVFFHISDEPSLDHLESYRRCYRQIKALIGDIPVIDAMSNIEFHREGVSGIPIPGTTHIEPFVADKVKPLFTYYCIGQWNKVSNRFFAMPSARNRIMGVLLYLYDLDGFLQWGYNFWFSQFSIRQDLNVFQVTDALYSFPSGDSFLVYPGKNGPVDSIRGRVFAEGLQDLRALRLLESKIGRAKVVKLLHDGLDYKMSMTEYPVDPAWILSMRERVNSMI